MKCHQPHPPHTPKKPGKASITCREIAAFLLDYTAGDLPAGERAEFDRHLKACPPCITYLDSYNKTVRLGKAALCSERDAAPPPMPEALVRAILAARAKAPLNRQATKKAGQPKTRKKLAARKRIR